jgi:GNAT superfamily N-acetyltransferase
MASELPDVVVRVAGAGDIGAIASLRSSWSAGAGEDPDFERRMAGWLAGEGDRRTIWLAMLGDSPVGMASVFEYRRMPRPGRPDSRWGYVSNMFVREDLRNRGIGSALLTTIITAADARCYARLVLSPSAPALRFYRRAGFTVPDDTVGDDRLLVRPSSRVGRRTRGVARSPMEDPRSRPDEEHFGEADLGEAQSSNPPDDPDMINPDADPLDTDVEDADLFLGLDDEDEPTSDS